MRPLIFDLDDTLIESFPPYVRLHQQIAAELGWRVPSRRELIVYGESWEATLARLWPEVDLQPFVARYDQLADHNPYRALPGARVALEELRERGHELWIVTKRSVKRLSQRMQQAELPGELFAGIFPCELQPAAKPDPRCFEPVWSARGRMDPSALFIGDRHEDHQAAVAARIEFVAVRTGPEAEAGFPRNLSSEQVLDSVAELPDWLRVRGDGRAQPSAK